MSNQKLMIVMIVMIDKKSYKRRESWKRERGKYAHSYGTANTSAVSYYPNGKFN